VIDDDPSVLDAMGEALRGWGVQAVKADSLSCALERLPECGRYPDAIISDFRLGEDSNGIDAVQRLRHELGFTVPALIVTGDTAPKSLRAIQSSGIGCLPKPVTADRLLHELSRLLQRPESSSTAEEALRMRRRA
jgi:DNA-binding NtrC family response regulator